MICPIFKPRNECIKSQSFIEPYLKANRKAEEAINAGVGREIAEEANGVTGGLPNRSANPIVRSRDIRERAIDRGRPISKSATVLQLYRLLPRTPIHMSCTQSTALSGSGFSIVVWGTVCEYGSRPK